MLLILAGSANLRWGLFEVGAYYGRVRATKWNIVLPLN